MLINWRLYGFVRIIIAFIIGILFADLLQLTVIQLLIFSICGFVLIGLLSKIYGQRKEQFKSQILLLQYRSSNPDGKNINDGCGATSMQMISAAVLEHKADLGIALDGDGDRLMMVDHTGYVIDGDEVVYIIACNDMKSGDLQGGVVGTLMSNMGLELALEQLDIPFARSNVGDRYVMELLREKGWQLGAENSGHIINLNHTSTGDGIIAALNVLTAVKQQNKSLFELRQGMTMLPQVLVNVRFSGDTDPINSTLVQQSVEKANAQLEGRGRVLLRKSGTEPLIRVMVEGSDHDEVTTLANEIAESVKTAS